MAWSLSCSWLESDTGGVLNSQICFLRGLQCPALKPDVLEDHIAHFIARAEPANFHARQAVADNLKVLEHHVPNGAAPLPDIALDLATKRARALVPEGYSVSAMSSDGAHAILSNSATHERRWARGRASRQGPD